MKERPYIVNNLCASGSFNYINIFLSTFFLQVNFCVSMNKTNFMKIYHRPYFCIMQEEAQKFFHAKFVLRFLQCCFSRTKHAHNVMREVIQPTGISTMQSERAHCETRP